MTTYNPTPVIGYTDGIVESNERPVACTEHFNDDRPSNTNHYFEIDGRFYNVHPRREDLGGYPVRWIDNSAPIGWPSDAMVSAEEPSAASVTLCRGGTGERTVDLHTHSVPDAWHAIQRLRDNPESHVMAGSDANLIEELWMLAHAMRDKLVALDNRAEINDGQKDYFGADPWSGEENEDVRDFERPAS